MDLSSKMLREVEFRDRLRGYDTDEVDEFLERVAVGIDELHAQLVDARARLSVAPAPVAAAAEPQRSPLEDDDTIKRTLILAQRTADLAISEAKAEAETLLVHARGESDRLLAEAQETARRLESAAEFDLRQRVTALTAEREGLEHDVRKLASLIDGERTRLTELVGTLASQVAGLGVSDALGSVTSTRSEPSPPIESAPAPAPAPFLDDDPEDAELEEASTDLELELDLAISPQQERPVTTPTQTYVAPAVEEHRNDADVDEALWERWANSGETDEHRADDPFQFGRTED
jgi:DivIVA domain-containing protein